MLSNVSWQVLVLISVVINSMGSGFTKFQVKRAGAFQVLLYKYIGSSLLITLIWALTDGYLPKSWWMAYLFGLIGGVNVALFTAAVRHSLSKSFFTVPIVKLGSIVWAAFLLNEYRLFDFSIFEGKLLILGTLLIPLIFWSFYEKSNAGKRWQKLIFLRVFFASLVPVLAKLFMEHMAPASMLMVSYWGSLTTAVGLTLIRSQKLYIDRKFALTGLAHGIINSLGIYLWLLALSLTEVTQVTLLRFPLTILGASSLGLFLFKEKQNLTKRKIFGMVVAAMLVGIVLLINR